MLASITLKIIWFKIITLFIEISFNITNTVGKYMKAVLIML